MHETYLYITDFGHIHERSSQIMPDEAQAFIQRSGNRYMENMKYKYKYLVTQCRSGSSGLNHGRTKPCVKILLQFN